MEPTTTGATLAQIQPLNNPKYINIQEAKNGYVVRMNNRTSYNEDTYIAKTKEEIISIISDSLKS